jgi:hypothetical protein
VVTFQERLAARKNARPFKDVQVLLDDHLQAERERLEAELSRVAGDQRLTAKSPADEIQEQINDLYKADDGLITLRFRRIPGNVWASLTSRHPARLDSPVDRRYGYNYDAVCAEAAEYVDADGAHYGVRLEGDEEVPLLVERKTPQNPNPANEWEDLFDALSGHEVETIRDAIWELNEYDVQVSISDRLKASGAATRS